MPDRRIPLLRRASLRDGITVAVATVGVMAICASSAVSVADDRVPSRITMVAQQEPAPAAPAVQAAPAPAPMPLPIPVPAPMPPPAPSYPDNLDGWIRQALDIMHAHNIPGSYDGIYRNAMRESTGNPHAINLWDSNAAAGIPSKGLLQVIDPTFQAYHIDGTSWDIYDPVANIVAACNYAARTYGSMDNVNSAY
ncbi:transglycosylase SLT domain-containing protein [Nocardia arthritidis]|uniref:Transglycosylase SLT domain-containing protein n=1 Tax=Nocardia arthritidis TaxID=228602 RepID=A0A6G9Y969_9NOCA|nr:transglycosylase SLT domain-containing protein [Nocardia arthritidis]QIS09761.1 transglycosylase SLT domain-containing protein [Nocardia arthritidis]